jgi:integrase
VGPTSAIRKVTLKDGTTRYRFKLDVGRDPVTGKRRQTELTFDTKREATAEYARIRHEVGRGTFVQPTKLLVGEFLDEWLASATRDVEKATAANYRDAIRPVRERLGDRALQSLTEADVERLVDWMLTEGRRRGGRPGSGLSPRSVQLTLGRFRNALELAVRRGLVVRNVAHYVTIPRAARRAAAEVATKRQPWTVDEVQAFLAGIRGVRLAAMVMLSLIGLRPAEVCGLRWSDVDLEAGILRAGENTRTLVDGEIEEKGAKSEKGKRGLPLPDSVLIALKAFKAKQAAEKLEAGDAYQVTGYVLVDELGAPVRPDWFRRRTHELMAQVGVRKVRLYDARHACLTYLAASGVPDVVVSAWAGHADLSLTKRVYVHPDVEHLRVAAKRLDEMLG